MTTATTIRHDTGCPETYLIDYQGNPRCPCGKVDPTWSGLRPFLPEPQDWKRWSNHLRLFYEVLKDGKRHTREQIEDHSGSKGFTGRISDLRKRGYDVKCERASDGGATTYHIAAHYPGMDLTGKHTCPTCTCKAG